MVDSQLVQFPFGEPAYIDVYPCAFHGVAKPPQRALADVTNTGQARLKDLEHVQCEGDQFDLRACRLSYDDIEKFPNTTSSTCLKTESLKGSDVLEIASYEWGIQRKSLRTSNRSVVSPKFDIHVGGHKHTFVITIVPKSRTKSLVPRSFQKSKGSVGIWLKCESVSDRPYLAFHFLIDGNASSTQVHDFAEWSACEISHVWDGLPEIPKQMEHDPEKTEQETAIPGLAVPIYFKVTNDMQ